MLERRYRRMGLIEDRRTWITQQHRNHKLYSIKQDHYWERKISDRDRNPKKLWKKLTLLTRQKKVRQELSKDLDAGMKAFHEGFPYEGFPSHEGFP